MRLTRNVDLAEDLTQEVFYNVFRSIETYDSSRNSLNSWIYRIAVNTFYKYKVRNSFRNTELLDESGISRIPEPGETQESNVDSRMIQEKILNAIDELPEPERSIIILKRLKNKTFKETAEKLSLSDRTIQRRLLKALEMLQESLQKSGIEME
jgi:RNA polymerase sigma-70 factor (ECF subfamily)